jgi:hypothetical protein
MILEQAAGHAEDFEEAFELIKYRRDMRDSLREVLSIEMCVVELVLGEICRTEVATAVPIGKGLSQEILNP